MFLKIRSVSRGQGGSAVAKAAYIARDRVRDAASGRIHDHRRVPGLEHASILAPTAAAGTTADWVRDRERLWNRAESAERNRNARVAREFTVALPHELPRETRIELARAFAQHIADRYGTVVDLAVHGPTSRGDPRNHHAHILSTTRELVADGLGRKATIELPNGGRRERGLPHVAQEFRTLRAAWAELANEHLREANVAARLEPRSRATLAREAALESRHEPARERREALDRDLSLEARQQRAAERWLAYRAALASGAAPRRERARERDLDAGFEL
jgi:ATP-dependent exoDNAse (exonuclease V) alpha subunit